MLATNVMFDTLIYAKKLKAVGFDDKQADAFAEINAELFKELSENHLATKQDTLVLKQDIASLRTEMQLMENRLFIKLGGLMTIGIGVLVTLLAILHGH